MFKVRSCNGLPSILMAKYGANVPLRCCAEICFILQGEIMGRHIFFRLCFRVYFHFPNDLVKSFFRIKPDLRSALESKITEFPALKITLPDFSYPFFFIYFFGSK